ncbi:hypothetical protein AURDEDRAFT_182675 [Auricularia subglabra TFB-10046 SS5]|nr:hypothetical protein AURDEDRAFT_182675 [Auricularia subglabra TFB-10046 SS5]
MTEPGNSISYIIPELRRRIASFCNRATLSSLCQVDKLWCAESNPILWMSLVLRVFYKSESPNAVEACLDALCASQWKLSNVTALTIYYPVDHARARELLQRTYQLIPRLLDLVDLRVYSGSLDPATVDGLLVAMSSQVFRETIRLNTLFLPQIVILGPHSELLEAALRAQSKLEVYVMHSHACYLGEAQFSRLAQPGVLPSSCALFACHGQPDGQEGNTLVINSPTPAVIDRLGAVSEADDYDYPWETVPIPPGASAPREPFIGGGGGDELDEPIDTDAGRATTAAVLAERAIRQFAAPYTLLPDAFHGELAARYGSITAPSARRKFRFLPAKLAGRMRDLKRLEVCTVKLFLDEIPDAEILRGVQAICQRARNITLAFRFSDGLQLTPRAVAAAVRPCRLLRTLNLNALRGFGNLRPAPANPREFLQAILDAGCYDLEKISFSRELVYVKSPTSGLWQIAPS